MLKIQGVLLSALLMGCTATPINDNDVAEANNNVEQPSEVTALLEKNPNLKLGEFTINGEKSVSLIYEEHTDSTILVEGDIILPLRSNGLRFAKSNVAGSFRKDIELNDCRWPGAIIPYNMDNISSLPTLQANIRNAMNIWEASTPIRFVNKNLAQCPGSVCVTFKIVADSGNPATSIGNHGDNFMWLYADNDQPIILHELGHKIGLAHEFARQDGLFFIDPNITAEEFIGASGYYTGHDGIVDYGAYDYASIMNYTFLDKKQRITTGVIPSAGDYLTVRSLYSSILDVRSANGSVFAARNLEEVGTVSSPIVALKVTPRGLPVGASYYYQAYNTATGWTSPKTNGQWLSNASEKPIQDVAIWLRNAPGYIPIYRAYSAALGGWLPWQANGDYAAKYHATRDIQKLEIKVMNTKLLQNRTAPYLCADIYAGITDTDGQNVQAWGCSDVSAQQFRLTAGTNTSASREILTLNGVQKWVTYLHIKTINDKCLVYKGSSGPEYNVEVGSCSENKATMWFYDFDNGQIKNANLKTMCLTIDNNLRNGSNLFMQTCGVTSKQKWDILDVNTPRAK